MIRQRKSPRRAVAAIELALVTSGILIPLLFGIWEIGRLIQVKQIVANSAREGARLASQGFTISGTGATVQVMTSTGTINVKDTVYQYLLSMGLRGTSEKLDKADVVVAFQFTSTTGANGKTNSASPQTEPYTGIKGQPLSVFVSVPWKKVRWIRAGFIKETTLVSFTAYWEMLRDDEFTVDPTLPSW